MDPALAAEQVDALASVRDAIEAIERTARNIEARLATSDFDGTEYARGRLADARRSLRWAAGDLDRAREQLREELDL